MQEVTRIYTLRITYIGQGEPEDMTNKEETAENLKNDIKSLFGCDDVVVEQVQDFVLDK